jgi:hypothetical protein
VPAQAVAPMAMPATAANTVTTDARLRMSAPSMTKRPA